MGRNDAFITDGTRHVRVEVSFVEPVGYITSCKHRSRFSRKYALFVDPASKARS